MLGTHTMTGDPVLGLWSCCKEIQKHVCRCTTTKFRGGPDEERRWLEAQTVVEAAAKAYCRREIDVDKHHWRRDAQVKIVPAKHLSQILRCRLRRSWELFSISPQTPSRQQCTRSGPHRRNESFAMRRATLALRAVGELQDSGDIFFFVFRRASMQIVIAMR